MRKGNRGKGDKHNGQDKNEPEAVVSSQLEDGDFRISIGLCCRNCAFGQLAQDAEGAPTGMVTCHARPANVVGSNPIVSTRAKLRLGDDLGDDRIQPYTMWPMLRETEWCRYFASPDEWLLELSERFGPESLVPDSEVPPVIETGANDA